MIESVKKTQVSLFGAGMVRNQGLNRYGTQAQSFQERRSFTGMTQMSANKNRVPSPGWKIKVDPQAFKVKINPNPKGIFEYKLQNDKDISVDVQMNKYANSTKQINAQQKNQSVQNMKLGKGFNVDQFLDTKYKARATLNVNSQVAKHIMQIDEPLDDDDVEMDECYEDLSCDYSEQRSLGIKLKTVRIERQDKQTQQKKNLKWENQKEEQGTRKWIAKYQGDNNKKLKYKRKDNREINQKFKEKHAAQKEQGYIDKAQYESDEDVAEEEAEVQELEQVEDYEYKERTESVPWSNWEIQQFEAEERWRQEQNEIAASKKKDSRPNWQIEEEKAEARWRAEQQDIAASKKVLKKEQRQVQKYSESKLYDQKLKQQSKDSFPSQNFYSRSSDIKMNKSETTKYDIRNEPEYAITYQESKNLYNELVQEKNEYDSGTIDDYFDDLDYEGLKN